VNCMGDCASFTPGVMRTALSVAIPSLFVPGLSLTDSFAPVETLAVPRIAATPAAPMPGASSSRRRAQHPR
jgi:hypothetical protein